MRRPTIFYCGAVARNMHASDALCIEPSLLKKSIISDFLGAMPGTRYHTNEIPEKLIIQGITKTGKAFRSGDWVERLCGVMSVFGADQQIRYSQHVRSIMMDRVGWGCIGGQARAHGTARLLLYAGLRMCQRPERR